MLLRSGVAEMHILETDAILDVYLGDALVRVYGNFGFAIDHMHDIVSLLQGADDGRIVSLDLHNCEHTVHDRLVGADDVSCVNITVRYRIVDVVFDHSETNSPREARKADHDEHETAAHSACSYG